jgi:diacylglycerol kinase family enzyme
VQHRKVRKAVISTSERVPFQLDGDPGGFVDGGQDEGWSVEVLPAAIEVLVPRGVS